MKLPSSLLLFAAPATSLLAQLPSIISKPQCVLIQSERLALVRHINDPSICHKLGCNRKGIISRFLENDSEMKVHKCEGYLDWPAFRPDDCDQIQQLAIERARGSPPCKPNCDIETSQMIMLYGVGAECWRYSRMQDYNRDWLNDWALID